MSDSGAQRPPLARNLSVIVGGVVLVELVFTIFLFVMARQASPLSSGTGRALLFGAVAAAVATVVALALWVFSRSATARITLPVWTARVLPVAALAVALVAAGSGGVQWLAVPLVFFATAPVCVVAMVAPLLLDSRRAAGAGPSVQQ